MKVKKKSWLNRVLTFVLAAMLFCGVAAPAMDVYAADTSQSKSVTYTNGDQYTFIYHYDTTDPYKKITKIEVKKVDTAGTETTSQYTATDSPSGDANAALNPEPEWVVGYKIDPVGSDVRGVIDDITDRMQPKADLDSAEKTLEPLMKIINTIIGMLSVVILIAVGFFTAVDVLYLEVPALHNSMDESAMAKGQTGKTGGVKPTLVSEDASQAYQEATNGENPKNPIIIYLKKRIVAYIAVAIVLFMLLSGNFGLIVQIVLKALGGVFGWFQDYANS